MTLLQVVGHCAVLASMSLAVTAPMVAQAGAGVSATVAPEANAAMPAAKSSNRPLECSLSLCHAAWGPNHRNEQSSVAARRYWRRVASARRAGWIGAMVDRCFTHRPHTDSLDPSLRTPFARLLIVFHFCARRWDCRQRRRTRP